MRNQIIEIIENIIPNLIRICLEREKKKTNLNRIYLILGCFI